MITSSNFVAITRLVGLANKDPRTTTDLTTRSSYNKGFSKPGVLKPKVVTTRVLSTRGSYNQVVLKPGVL